MGTARQRSSSGSSSSTKRKSQAATPSPAVSPQTPVPLPALDDRDGWRTHWQAQGQPWRTEPEIAEARQNELASRLSIVPDIENGIYPFKDMKLSRADVEWLLATHENGHGPADWSTKPQASRIVGLDLRGADLRSVDLQRLPLAYMIGGLLWREWKLATEAQRAMAGVHLEHANLNYTHLEKAELRHAHLQGANLRYAHLESAMLFQAHLEEAFFYKAHLEDTNLRETHLEGATLSLAFFDRASTLNAAVLVNDHYGPVSLLDVHWGEMNLATVDWSRLMMLGEEYKLHKGLVQGKSEKEEAYREAVRANRQLAIVLQSQGLNEPGARFAYRAQVLQRGVLWHQMSRSDAKIRQRFQTLGAWLFSWFLFLIAGYGYKPGRSFLSYFFVIFGFAAAYYLLGHAIGPVLSPLGAFVFSMTSFHGRGFFPGNNISLDHPLTVLAAFEALVGLIIEVTFIATLTQRFFNR